MKYLLTFLIIISTNSLASELMKTKLPTENLSFDLVDKHTPVTLVKDEFETTKEFNKRKERLSKSKPIKVYIEKSMTYNADKEEYSFSCYTGYNQDYTSIELKDDTSFIPRSGTNGFGAEWQWNEKVGKVYELRYKCPEINSVKVPLVDAKEIRDDFIAVIELELGAQNWSSKTNYESAEFGKNFVDKYSTNFKNANLIAIYFGQESNSSLYKKVEFPENSLNKIKLKPIITVAPDYPRRALRRGIEGYVELSYTVNEFGGVENIKVIASEPKGIFEDAAIKAMKKFKYKPLVLDGIPIKQEGNTNRMTFDIDN